MDVAKFIPSYYEQLEQEERKPSYFASEPCPNCDTTLWFVDYDINVQCPACNATVGIEYDSSTGLVEIKEINHDDQ